MLQLKVCREGGVLSEMQKSAEWEKDTGLFSALVGAGK